MKTTTIKRDYLSTIFFLISIGISFFVYFSLENYYNATYSEYRNALPMEGNDYSLATVFQNEMSTYNFLYMAFIIFAMLFLVVYILIRSHFILSIFYAIFCAFIISDVNLKLDSQSNLNGFIFLILFAPYFYYIFVDLIKGELVDLSAEIVKKKELEVNRNLVELKILKDAGVINETQYAEKTNQSIQSKNKTNFMISDEYKVLFNLKQKGVFSEEEFNKKVEEMVNKSKE